MNPFVAAIWGLALLGTLAGFVPNAVSWLIRTLAAAKQIERYSEEILASGEGIARNTAGIAALKDTIAVAPGLVSGAQSIGAHAEAIRAALVEGQDGPRAPKRGGRS